MSETGTRDTLRVRVATSLKGVPAAAWDACANPPGLPFEEAGERFNPFLTAGGVKEFARRRTAKDGVKG